MCAAVALGPVGVVRARLFAKNLQPYAPQLQQLGLAENALGKASGVALAEALGKGATPQLQWLVLDDNALGKRGAAALAAAAPAPVCPRRQQLEAWRQQRACSTAAAARRWR